MTHDSALKIFDFLLRVAGVTLKKYNLKNKFIAFFPALRGLLPLLIMFLGASFLPSSPRSGGYSVSDAVIFLGMTISSPPSGGYSSSDQHTNHFSHCTFLPALRGLL